MSMSARVSSQLHIKIQTRPYKEAHRWANRKWNTVMWHTTVICDVLLHPSVIITNKNITHTHKPGFHGISALSDIIHQRLWADGKRMRREKGRGPTWGLQTLNQIWLTQHQMIFAFFKVMQSVGCPSALSGLTVAEDEEAVHHHPPVIRTTTVIHQNKHWH